MPDLTMPALVVVIHLFVAAIGVVTVAYKLVDLVRDPRRPAMWALWVALLTLTMAVISGITGGDRLLPAPAIWIGQHLLILGSLLASEAFFWFSVHPGGRPGRAAWRHGGLLLGLMLAMTATFVPALVVDGADLLAPDYRREPWLLGTVLIYGMAFAVATCTIARLSGRWARIADRIWLRRGLATLTAGYWIGSGYAVHHVVYTVLAAYGIAPYPQSLEILPIAAGLIVAVTGITMPAWGPRVSALRRWFGHARSCRRLAPLWREFVAMAPHIALPSPAPWWDAEFRLYRRVVEIWDGRLEIRHHLVPGLAERALLAGRRRGLTGDELAAAVEAECLHAAIRAGTESPGGSGGAPNPVPDSGDDLAAEVAFLELVAAALRGPRLVRAGTG